MPQYNTAQGPIKFPDAKSIYPTISQVPLGRAMALGLGLGALGALVMSGSNKIEQFFTHRPGSYVPGRTMATHLGLSSFYGRHPDVMNHLHHFGMGILAGPVRAVMSYYGVIGPVATFMHTGVRILLDEVVEISAGVGSLPWTWPINEQVIDILHKSVYSIVVGYCCDRMVRGVDWFNY